MATRVEFKDLSRVASDRGGQGLTSDTIDGCTFNLPELSPRSWHERDGNVGDASWALDRVNARWRDL